MSCTYLAHHELESVLCPLWRSAFGFACLFLFSHVFTGHRALGRLDDIAWLGSLAGQSAMRAAWVRTSEEHGGVLLQSLLLCSFQCHTLLPKATLDSGFVAWAYMAFNERYRVMADPLTRLALFLHPGYRLVGNQEKEFEALQLAVRAIALCNLTPFCA